MPEEHAKVLSNLVIMVESDLMKARHYIELGIKVAIAGNNEPAANDLAAQFVELDDFVKRYQTTHATLIDKGIQK